MSEQPNFEAKLGALSSDLSTLKDLIKAGFQKVENNFEVVKKDVELTHKKIEGLTQRIESLEKRVEYLSKNLESLDVTTSDGFTDVGMKIESLTDEIVKIGAVTSYDQQYKNMQGLN